MSFGQGKDSKVYAHGTDATPYLSSASLSKEVDTADSTCFGSDDKWGLAGLRDAMLALEGMFDSGLPPDDGLGSAGSIYSFYPQGDAVDAVAHAGGVGKHIVADLVSAESDPDVGEATPFSMEIQSDAGSEQAESLHDGSVTETASDVEEYVNDVSMSVNGGSAYIHVLSKTGGTNITGEIEHSDNHVDWSSLVAFTAQTAQGTAERKAIVGTIKQYVRAKWTLGAGGSWKFNIALHRA